VVVGLPATPVNALFIPGCGEFTIFADKGIGFENGPPASSETCFSATPLAR
jgi:hypothetical protein